MPLLLSIFALLNQMLFYQYGFSIVFLAFPGILAATAGGSKIVKSVLGICVWGTIAMVISALTGYIFGVNVH